VNEPSLRNYPYRRPNQQMCKSTIERRVVGWRAPAAAI
jgi:hypothetical protein